MTPFDLAEENQHIWLIPWGVLQMVGKNQGLRKLILDDTITAPKLTFNEASLHGTSRKCIVKKH